MRLSIISISFNDVDGLKKTAASVLAQDVQSFEWIVIDGGSSDGTIAYLTSNVRVDSYVSERDDGIYDAMAKGLARATGEWIVFLNAGDTFATDNAVSQIFKDMSDFDIFFYSTLVRGAGVDYVRVARDIRSAKYSVPGIQQSTVYKKVVLDRIEWPVDCKICGDYAIAAQFLANGAKSKSSKFVLSHFFLGGVSTINVFGLAFEAFCIQRRYLRLPVYLLSLHFLRRVVTGQILKTLHWTTDKVKKPRYAK